MGQGDGVGQPAVDQLAALEIDGGEIKGQRAGGLAQPARAVVVLFGVVVPLEGKRVGTDGDKLRGRRKEGGKIKGDVLRGDIVKDETGVHDGAMAQEIARMQIVGTVGVALRHLPVAPSLTAHIGNPIACRKRRQSHRETQLVHQEGHPARRRKKVREMRRPPKPNRP